jgi:hypothetical protein
VLPGGRTGRLGASSLRNVAEQPPYHRRAGHGFDRFPLLKSTNTFDVVNPGSGNRTFRSGPNSVVELPPKLLMVPGRNLPPSCHVQLPCRKVVEKSG